ncbi:MAG TPA: universal stress protein [Chitinophagaceae bacterium]
MKKILIISNEFGFTQSVVRFALAAARADGSLLHSIFLQPLRKAEEVGYLFPNDYRLTGQNLTGDTYQQEDQRIIASNLQYFKNECDAAGIAYSIDTERETNLKELFELTWFADLVVVDADAELGPYRLEELLAGSHCPVCVVPSRAEEVEQLVLCYDGSEHALYALKLFSYLLPQWSGKPSTLITVNNNPVAASEEEAIQSWLQQHFPGAQREVLPGGDPSREIVRFTQRWGGKALVVLGAYSRGAVSRLLHRSTADALLEATAATLFIAHR